MDKVVFSFLGVQLDRVEASVNRWDRWRPNVNLMMRDDLEVHRLELFVQKGKFSELTQQVIKDVKVVSPETEVVVNVLDIADPWDFQSVYEALHDFSLSYSFSPDQEEYLVHMTTGTHVAQICLFLLVEAHFFPATLLQGAPPSRRDRSGQGRYYEIDLDLSKYDALATRFAEEREEAQSLLKSGIETKNKRFNRMIEQIETVAVRSREPILLTGPTGAGKSYLAQKIYALRQEKMHLKGRLVEVNCATLRGDMAMSLLFGHTKGAFTGALSTREGLLRQADGGMLFLDEIGELGLDEQAMLLRAIEEGRWLPVGADTEQQAEFLVISGTNKDLMEAVRKGEFREDLWARLNVWTYVMPGLAERREDIAPNLEYELKRFSKVSRQGVTMNAEARERFLAFAQSSEATWKGNFRDLKAAVTRMATLAPRGRIRVTEVEEEIQRLQKAWAGLTSSANNTSEVVLSQVLSPQQIAQIDPFDRVQLEYVLSICQQSQSISEAGRTVFEVSRQKKVTPNDADRLKKYLSKYDLNFKDVLQALQRL